MSDIFEYEIPFEGKAALRVDKSQIVHAISIRLNRPLTSEEGDKVWADIKHEPDWYVVFPIWAEKNGVKIDDKMDFTEMLKEDIEYAASKVVNDMWEEVHENLLKTSLDKIAASIYAQSEEITLANIEQQSQKRIQEDNVRNGLARCANETKKKSIEKWKRNYFLMEHNLDIQNIVLPDGKTEDEFMKHLEAFVKH